jgi:hypothetical protein
MAVNKRPGEGVMLGKPIVTIAADRSEFIIGYLREDHMIRPTEGMVVQIQSRTKPARSYRSHVQSVGAQVEAMPFRYWRNPTVPEWGLPIQVALPEGIPLAPGEMVDLVVRPGTGR